MNTSEQLLTKKIAEAIAQAGGKTYYVGGYVRDLLLGKTNKDIDIEVHGVTAESLMQILSHFGEPMTKGAAFGIMSLRHYDIDIALPRSEKSTGRGHKNFEIFTDPFIGEKKAASRRDFTINALMQDVLSGEILDFFGGQQDLEHHLLRHVSEKSFAEDPLRVFRAAQFASRFNFDIAEETLKMMKAMDVTTLSRERVFGETEKALMKARQPSVYFEVLRNINQLSYWFSELLPLIDCPQNPVFHPEGDVWTHTMQVLDESAKLRSKAMYPLWLMFSALTHDLGKPLVTAKKNGVFHAYGHETAGLPVVDQFLHRLTAEHALIKYVVNMTALHMKPNIKVAVQAPKKSFMKMFDASLCPEDLLLLAKSDHLGRHGKVEPSSDTNHSYAETERFLQKMLQLYWELMAKPCLKGEDLINAGIAPGPVFKAALDYAHKLRLAGLSKETQLKQTLGFIRSYK